MPAYSRIAIYVKASPKSIHTPPIETPVISYHHFHIEANADDPSISGLIVTLKETVKVIF
jgi:hypothetical protein